MESPTPGSRYVARSSKERVFPGGSSSSGFKKVEILETVPSSKIILQPMSSKKKEVVCEIIDVDIEEDCLDAMFIDGEADRKGKGKEISSNFPVGVSNLTNNGPGSDIPTSKNINVDDLNSNLFFGEDEWIDTYYDDITFDDYTVFESHFDHMDLPTGVEVPFPWLACCPQNSTNSTSSFQIESNGANLVPDSTSSHSSLKLKSIESKDQTTSSKSNKGSRATSSHSSMLLGTDCGWRKSTTKSSTAYLSSQFSRGTESYKLGNEPPLFFGKGKRKSSALQFPSGVIESTSSMLNIVEPSGFMNGSAFFGHGAQDSGNNQNGEPLGKVEQNLDEVLRNFDLFKKFDTVEDCSDHYYVNKGSSSKQVKPPKNWAKRIQEEWKILEKDLPDTIFVRVYESRIDLLRAVIVGAEGTPYHDGLFFFDVLFPGSYPNDPPEVHYHSGGLRINPNLYNCGKVCLSLLNTWSGTSQKEQWIPGVSTMLQVLVSIQGLILNVDPFFNEPGYAGLSGTESGEKRSLKYNETTFIYSLQTMVYTMKRPPKHFEALVVGHFCKHARDILVSCKAYLDGAQVGCLVRGGVQDVDEGDKACSQDFKCKLAGFITTLINTFSKIGSKDYEEFLSLGQRGNGRAATATHRAVKSRKNVEVNGK